MPKKKRAAKPRERQPRAAAPIPTQPPAPAAPGSFDHWEGKLTETERRVDAIVQRMQQGAWLSGVSERALAKEWNISPISVRHHAVEAGRVIRRQLRDDPEAQKETRAAIVQTFEVIRAKAMAKGDPASLRVALDATRALGFYMGVEPAKKLDVTERVDPFEGWSVAELEAFAAGGTQARRAVRVSAALPMPSDASLTSANGELLDADDGESDGVLQ
jgi:hypothetical protein